MQAMITLYPFVADLAKDINSDYDRTTNALDGRIKMPVCLVFFIMNLSC
jgi:hypothetical protein